jgi:ferredoxin
MAAGDARRAASAALLFDTNHLQCLIDVLAEDHEVLGPTVIDGTIAVAPLRSVDDLPVGWHDHQEPGGYHLEHASDLARFAWAVGAQTWKPLLHRPEQAIWTILKDQHGHLRVEMAEHPPRARALFGMRPCEIAAIRKLDRVLLAGDHADESYRSEREGALVVAVDCGSPAATCFCSSMDTGPACTNGADIVLTELIEGPTLEPSYLAAGQTVRGQDVLDRVAAPEATETDVRAATEVTAAARERMRRTVDADRLPGLLRNAYQAPRWDDVARRCLTCGNCTAVCPTCFCTTMVDTTSLRGDTSQRTRVWDTCFSLDFSHLASGPARESPSSRYRQWLTHKLGTWWDQFGESGCVGCGRCITWCPVGIDITEEARLLQAHAEASS